MIVVDILVRLLVCIDDVMIGVLALVIEFVLVELPGELHVVCPNIKSSSWQMDGTTATSTFVSVTDSSLIIACSDFIGSTLNISFRL